MADVPNADVTGITPAPATNGGYSAEYVKSLRDENAGWRTKLRETESALTTVQGEVAQIKLDTTVGSELKKRNLNVDAKWITIGEGQSVEQAVDKFLVDYPQMATDTSSTQITSQQKDNGTKLPINTQKKPTNSQGNQQNDVQTVKNDPVARAKLRDQYRSMLAEGHAGTTI